MTEGQEPFLVVWKRCGACNRLVSWPVGANFPCGGCSGVYAEIAKTVNEYWERVSKCKTTIH